MQSASANQSVVQRRDEDDQDVLIREERCPFGAGVTDCKDAICIDRANAKI
jgi:hypothetical protein